MKIESKLSKYNNYVKIFVRCIETVNKYISNIDTQGLSTIALLDSNERNKYHNTGGTYFLERDNIPPHIELYVEEILKGMPKFVPKSGIFLRYAAIKMILHEIGHHVNRRYAYERNNKEWEKSSDTYTLKYLWRIYGLWMYIFLTIGSIENKLKIIQ